MPNNNRVPLVVTYNPALPWLKSILKEHHQILNASLRCKNVFERPPLITYRKGRNLTQILTCTSTRIAPPSSGEPAQLVAHASQLPNIYTTPDRSETKCRVCGRIFRSSRSLKIHFTQKHRERRRPDHSRKPGFWPCGTDPRCACCKSYGTFAEEITSTSNRITVKLRENTMCCTSNVIYLITCAKCKQQYVRETSNCVRMRAIRS